jgi:hypothetical protein
MKGLLAAVLSAGVLVLIVGATAATAGSSTVNGTAHCDPSDPACQINPLLTGSGGVTLPGNCPAFLTTDAWELNFTSGNAVQHGTENKNGDWGGGTVEGPAILTMSDGTPEYSGHATAWFGGGNNSGGQSEGGFTLTFNGSGTAGTISIHVDQHSTTNNSGTPTSNVFHVTVTCS